VASTTWSKRSVPASVATETPVPERVMRRTGVRRRLSARPATIFSTYWREPPRTVRHCGRLAIWIRPWLWQKRIMVATGNASICVVEQLQMQPIIGRKYQSRNALPKRCASRNSPSGWASSPSVPASAIRVVRRLKRSRSPSMPRKRRVEQVAPLGEHGAEVVAAPFERAAAVARGLHRERHLGQRRFDAQFGEEADQVRVGAVVVDQEAGVHAVRHARGVGSGAGQFDGCRVGVATEVVTGFEQGDGGNVAQRVRRGQARDAGADDGDAGRLRSWRDPGPAGRQKCCEAPRREGGREGGGEESPRDFNRTAGARKTSQHENRWALTAHTI
jgi:hypothetical protein